MARRSFTAELDDRIKADAVARLIAATPDDAQKLLKDAGYIQGLKAARDLFDEVMRSNLKADEG